MRAAGAIAVLIVSSACGGAIGAPSHIVERSGAAMGSDLHLTAWTSDDAAARAAFDDVLSEFDRLDSLMSVWRPGSDILRINDAAGVRPVAVSAEVRDALHTAQQVSEWTAGRFDVTVGPLADLWKFDRQNADQTIPSAADIRARLPLVDYRRVEIDDRAGTVFLRRAGMRLHLGGIGKGYAVGRAAAVLRRAGFRDFVIQAGGDLYAAGQNGERPWRLGINDPRGPDGKTFANVDLSDATFSTSGDYARFFIKDGIRYHHIIDLTTGQPARGCRSVTIVADSPTLADALSTGVFALGPVEGMALIERLPHVGGVIVSAGNDVLVSSGLKGKVTIVSPPTDAP
jgi:FAD:protein FMN transferase